MATLDGYDLSNFATFDNISEPPKQLPSLPIDDVLPKADVQSQVQTEKKSVSFEEEAPEKIEANVILPKKQEAKSDFQLSDSVQKIFEECGPYLFAIIFIIVAYWYSQRY